MAGVTGDNLPASSEALSTVSPQNDSRTDPVCAYYVESKLYAVETSALVDTGACACLVSEEFFHKLPTMDLKPSTNCGLEGIVAGSALDVRGIISVPLQIGSHIFEPHNFLVARGIAQQCLLGIDFLDRFRITVNTDLRQLSIPSNDCTVDVPVKTLHPVESKVESVHTVEVPPRTVCPIIVKVRGLGVDVQGCIEGNEIDHPNFLIPRSMNWFEGGLTQTEVINFTDSAVYIQKGQILGSFELLTPVNMCTVGGNEHQNRAPRPDIRDLFDLTDTDLTDHQKDLVYGLLESNSDIVGTSEFDLGLTSTIEHKIELEDSGPVKQPYRRFPAPLRAEIREEIQKLLDIGVIEPSKSAWSSPLVPVRKKNGALRMCVDFRALNSRTKKDSFPLPNIADSVSRFRNCRYFSSLDLLQGYHQIAVEEGSREFTAFSDGNNLYQYCRMPFGVCNGPASFSRLVAVVLSGVPFDIANAYLDDIIVAGGTFEEHMQNVQLVFTRLAQHGLKLNSEKCKLFQGEVEYLGHTVGREGIKPLDKNIQAIVEYPQPKTIRQLRTFNGMVNYYKKYLAHSSDMMRPLYRATSNKKLVWTKECEVAFGQAKQALLSAPILAYPDFSSDQTFIVTCDASALGAGATLSQVQSGEEKVIGYAGVSFNPAQCKYSPTDRELAAIRFAVVHFKPLLYGRKFIIRTDHEPLIYLYHMRRFDDRLHRTLEDLNIGHYELEYVPGKTNVIADALSRARYPWVLPEEDNRVCWEPEVSLEKFAIVEVQGGGDSLFQALSILVDNETANTIRDHTATLIRKNPSRYGYENNSRGHREIELVREPGYFAPLTVLQAVADYLNSRITVYFEAGPTFTYVPTSETSRTLHVLCCGGVHFNALKLKQPAVTVSAVRQPDTEHQVVSELTLTSSSAEFRAAQMADSNLRDLRRIVKAGMDGVLPAELSGFEPKRTKLTVDNEGVLVFENFPGKFVPVVPTTSLRALALELHVALSHSGRDKTTSIMFTKLCNPDFPKVIASVVKECQTCQKHKGSPSNKHPMYRRHVERPYELYAVDLMDLPKSKRGFKAVLTGVDLYTKFAHVVPLRSKRSETVARALEMNILATVPRTPKAILSDNGPEFRGAPFNKLLSKYGIEHEFSVPYAPNTNGAVERFNQTLRSRLATVCDGKTRHWDRHLYHIVAQYNRTPHAETNKAPTDFFVRDSEIILPTKPRTWRNAPKFKSFVVGDLILRKTPYQNPTERDKLAPKYQGPYRIVSVDPNGITYRAILLGGGRNPTITVHQSQIKRFNGPLPPVQGGMRQASPSSPKGRDEQHRVTFGLDVDKLNRIPYRPREPVNNEPAPNDPPNESNVRQSIFGSPIPIRWGESNSNHSSDPDAGVLSDGCAPYQSRSSILSGIISGPGTPVSGSLSETDLDAPHVAASTPIRRKSHRNFNRDLPPIEIEPIPGPYRTVRFEGTPPNRDLLVPDEGRAVSGEPTGPSVMRHAEGEMELELDVDGVYFVTDMETSTRGPIRVTLDLEQMEAYYSLGLFNDYPEWITTEPAPPEESGGCLPCSHCPVM